MFRFSFVLEKCKTLFKQNQMLKNSKFVQKCIEAKIKQQKGTTSSQWDFLLFFQLSKKNESSK